MAETRLPHDDATRAALERVWNAAKRCEALLAGHIALPERDRALLQAARDVAARIEMYSDGCAEKPLWRYLEKLGRTVINLLEMLEPGDDAADRTIADAHAAAGFIDQECGKEAAKVGQ